MPRRGPESRRYEMELAILSKLQKGEEFSFTKLFEEFRSKEDRRIRIGSPTTLSKLLKGLAAQHLVEFVVESRKWRITQYGKLALRKAQIIESLDDQETYLSGDVQPKLDFLQDLVAIRGFPSPIEILSSKAAPVPLSSHCTLYTSKEAGDIFSWIEWGFMVGERREPEPSEKLEIWTSDLVRGIVNEYILQKLFFMAKLEKYSMDLKDLIGFDLTFVFEYRGKKFLKEATEEEIQKVKHGLTGLILLYLSGRWWEGSEKILTWLFRKGCLDPQEAEELRFFYQPKIERQGPVEIGSSTANWDKPIREDLRALYGHEKPIGNAGEEAFFNAAWRHFKLAGLITDPDDLDRIAVDWRDRVRLQRVFDAVLDSRPQPPRDLHVWEFWNPFVNESKVLERLGNYGLLKEDAIKNLSRLVDAGILEKKFDEVKREVVYRVREGSIIKPIRLPTSRILIVEENLSTCKAEGSAEKR